MSRGFDDDLKIFSKENIAELNRREIFNEQNNNIKVPVISAWPDLIIICGLEHKYDYKMELAAESVNILQNAIETAGFDKKDLKTTNFNIRTHYESYEDENDNYKNRFDGYICKQGLKLEFDFNTEVLSKLLNAVGKAPDIEPEDINVSDTVTFVWEIK